MFAVVAQKTSWSWDKLMFNWFDVAVLLLLAFGLWRGRKRGMSREFLSLSMWLVLVLGAGFGYQMLAEQLLHYNVTKAVFSNQFNLQTATLVSSYLLIAMAVAFIFSLLKRHYKPKLEGSNAFGSSEYYLGMVAGLVRYACILLAALALLNAPIYSVAEIQATKAYNKRWLGGGMYEGDYLPNLQTVQANVFKQSLFGPFIKDKLSMLIINSGPPAAAKKSVHY